MRPGATLRLRPLAFGELLDEIFRIYRRHFWLLLAISLILAVPSLLVQILSGQADQLGFIAGAFGNLGNPPAQPASTPRMNLGWYGVQYLVLILLVPLVEGVVTLAAIDLALGNPVTLVSAFMGVLRRYWDLFRLTLLVALLALTACCLPLFLWIFIRWAVAVPVMLAEGVGPVRAVQRSWELTRGSWWRLFGILLVAYLLQSIAGAILGAFAFPIAILVPFVSGAVKGAIALSATTLGSAVVTPILYLCVVLMYFDLRIRRESFDLDQLARQASGE